MTCHYRLNFRMEFLRNFDWKLSNWFGPSLWKVTVVTMLPPPRHLLLFLHIFSPVVANLEPMQSLIVICRTKRARAYQINRFFYPYSHLFPIHSRQQLSMAPILASAARQVSCGSHDIFSGPGPNVPGLSALLAFALFLLAHQIWPHVRRASE